MIKVRELSTADVDALAPFYACQTGTAQEMLQKRLLWLGRNPTARPDIPLGAGAYRGEDLCGSMLYIPMRFSDGADTRTCILSILFYVDVSARGAGLPLFMAFRSLADRYPLYASTANLMSARLWSAFGGVPIQECQFEYVRFCRVAPAAAELLLRAFGRTGPVPTGDNDGPPDHPRTDRLVPVEDVSSALREVPQPKTASYSLVLDAETIRWRVYDSGQRLYRYLGKNSDCLCVFQRSRRGVRAQMSGVEIVEVWGRLDARDFADFKSQIRQAFRPDVISFRGGSPLARMDGFVRKFRRREFACSTVWLIDPQRLLDNRFEFSGLAGE